jgi:hypothetical protein
LQSSSNFYGYRQSSTLVHGNDEASDTHFGVATVTAFFLAWRSTLAVHIGTAIWVGDCPGAWVTGRSYNLAKARNTQLLDHEPVTISPLKVKQDLECRSYKQDACTSTVPSGSSYKQDACTSTVPSGSSKQCTS